MAGRMGTAWIGAVALAGLAIGAAMMGRDRSPESLPRPTLAFDGPVDPSFMNFESPHVHPLDLTPDRQTLLAVNTSGDRVEVFSVAGGGLAQTGFVEVGIEPVSVRARTNSEAWAINHVSGTISVVNLVSENVVRTLTTLDEPCDVVFAGSPQRAFVTCQRQNTVLVFDPANLDAPPVQIPIDAERPRALAVSPDGSTVYAAIFESGNATTILGGGIDVAAHGNISFPPNVVSDPTGPYGGQNPPPNSGTSFNPPLNPNNPAPPAVGLIVRKDAAGHWMDDNNHDWTAMVSGPDAAKSGRPVGWDMPDHDLAVINTSTLGVTYATGLMTMCMAVGVNPANGKVTVVGTEALNQIRYEPVVRGKFIRVEMATVAAANLASKTIVDLNPHLDYSVSTIIESERDRAIGDPRAIVWNSAGTKGYVTGLGSDNIIVIDPSGARAGLTETIPVAEGPTGLVIDDANDRLYVLSRFGATVTAMRPSDESFVQAVAFFDPTPEVVRKGRRHLFGTHRQSGLGQIACASCHVDARMDRLAWDLGDPSGSMTPLENIGINEGFGVPHLEPGTASPPFAPYHPMKGPIVTQTLQDIIGHEPFHWRGDRQSLHDFLGAFTSLQGAVYTADMQEFEDYLATVAVPPDPYRPFSNALPQSLPLTGHFKTGRFGDAGAPLGVGNAYNGMLSFRDNARNLDGGRFACVTCHTLPTGLGTDMTWNGSYYEAIPVGSVSEHHIGCVTAAGVTNITMKVPQLRNMYQKTGFDMVHTTSNAGFGYGHDGSIDTLERFVSMDAFQVADDQEVGNIVAFLLSFSGSGLPSPNIDSVLRPPGVKGHDVPAAVGTQMTLSGAPTSAQSDLLSQMIDLAGQAKVGLIAKGLVAGEKRGYAYLGQDIWQGDKFGDQPSTAQILGQAAPGSEVTFTVVPVGSETRLGIDRDLDGCYDGDEAGGCICLADFNKDGFVTGDDFDEFTYAFFYGLGSADVNGDGFTNGDDFDAFAIHFDAGC